MKAPRREVVIAVVVVVLIVMIALVRIGSSRYDNYLSGMWVGDPGFLESAQILDFQLFLAPSSGKERQGYLIITDMDGSFTANQAIELELKPSLSGGWSSFQSIFKTSEDLYNVPKVDLEFDDDEGPTPMPSRLKLSMSILDGTLTLFDDEKVYAFLEKDLASTAAAVEAYHE